MTCYHPLTAYRGPHSTVVFNPRYAWRDLPPFKVPCNQCIGCRLNRSRQWAMRCTFEAQMYDDNCFITLTYDNTHLPRDYSLDKSHWQKFMKRLRKYFGEPGIRYFHAGEYGDRLGRPHYHAIVFNLDFEDKKLWMIRNGHRLYRSPTLENLWPFGYSTVGTASFESAAYVARYCLKKVTGNLAKEYYSFVDNDTGEVFTRIPEYATMSRRPGIGRAWYDEYRSDVYPLDAVVMRGGLKLRPPRYFDNLYQIEFPEEFKFIKRRRNLAFKEVSDSFTGDKLANREYNQLCRLENLPRVLL